MKTRTFIFEGEAPSLQEIEEKVKEICPLGIEWSDFGPEESDFKSCRISFRGFPESGICIEGKLKETRCNGGGIKNKEKLRILDACDERLLHAVTLAIIKCKAVDWAEHEEEYVKRYKVDFDFLKELDATKLSRDYCSGSQQHFVFLVFMLCFKPLITLFIWVVIVYAGYDFFWFYDDILIEKLGSISFFGESLREFVILIVEFLMAAIILMFILGFFIMSVVFIGFDCESLKRARIRKDWPYWQRRLDKFVEGNP